MRYIQVREEVCSGCRACEIACVVHHEGRFGTSAARLRVLKIEAEGLDQPQVCRLCRRPPCVDACSSQALYRDEGLGVVLLRPGECDGCAECVDACPFGVVVLHPETGLPLICDLCGGEPACVVRCATGAISYGHEAAVSPGKQHDRSIEPDGAGKEAA